MREFKECTLYGDMASDSASEQYPTEKVCKSCIRKYDKPDEDVILSVGRSLGKGDASECYFSDGH